MKKILLLLGCFMLSAQSMFAAQISGNVKAKYNLQWNSPLHHWMKTEANIALDHTVGDAWVATNIRAWTFDANHMGINLDKALIGYRAYDSVDTNISVEVGKNRLEDMFDSKVQFDTHFIGVKANVSYISLSGHRLFVHGGPFVIDTIDEDYGFVAEGIFTPAIPYPVTVKYSFTGWTKDYLISQITGSYQVFMGSVYGAFLMNNSNKTPLGFYIGYTYGSLNQPKDFMVDVNYQFTEADLVPEFDRKGLRDGLQAKFSYALSEKIVLHVKDEWDFKFKSNRMELAAIYRW